MSRAVEGSGSAGLARCRNGHRTFEWWVWMGICKQKDALWSGALKGLDVHVGSMRFVGGQ